MGEAEGEPRETEYTVCVMHGSRRSGGKDGGMATNEIQIGPVRGNGGHMGGEID